MGLLEQIQSKLKNNFDTTVCIQHQPMERHFSYYFGGGINEANVSSCFFKKNLLVCHDNSQYISEMVMTDMNTNQEIIRLFML